MLSFREISTCEMCHFIQMRRIRKSKIATQTNFIQTLKRSSTFEIFFLFTFF